MVVVDVDRDTVETLEAVLGLLAPAARVLGFAEGPQAQRLAQEEHVDVLLADDALPCMAEGALFRWFHEHSPRTYRVLMSGHPEPRGMDLAHAFLRKPFHFESLARAIPFPRGRP